MRVGVVEVLCCASAAWRWPPQCRFSSAGREDDEGVVLRVPGGEGSRRAEAGGRGMATCRVNSTFADAARARSGSVRIEGMQRQGWQGDGRVEQGVEYGEQVALHCHALGQMVQVGERAVVMARMQCLVRMPCSSK